VSLNLPPLYQINNMEYRLYQLGSMTDPTTAPAPSVGNPLPSGATLVNAWVGATASNPTDTLTFNNLAAGTYILDVAGTTAGLAVARTPGSCSWRRYRCRRACGCSVRRSAALASSAAAGAPDGASRRRPSRAAPDPPFALRAGLSRWRRPAPAPRPAAAGNGR
jgi:hypothetical protein